ncbi:zwei Ig domain protein zig-3-like [Mya arenaria]|uniref:zwei Ig domain protein zig-3-like n=1 Tax=Mya arenaria TaxID=6604 RepID=UPI0022E21BAA|nr:zwei Ig domain protein zig-3-like [Mya arenaria]
MIVDGDRLVKLMTLIFTALNQIHFAFSFKGFSMRSPEQFSMLAKRGGGGDWRVAFKGDKFEEKTFAARQDDIVLECEAGGSPSPTIHWLKDGERIQQGVSRDYLDDEAAYEEKLKAGDQRMLRLGKVKSKLFLDCVSDRDEGVYTCVAETPYERIAQTTVLQMEDSISSLSRKSCLTKKAFRGEPARIHLWTAVRVEFESAPVQLFCRADGYPAPTCTWRYTDEGKPIEDDEHHKLLPNGDLLIGQISWRRNMGDYYCMCENESGVDEISTFLYPTRP